MSVPDTLRMDLADPRIYDEITIDRQQALALVNEVDSLRDQAKKDSKEIDRLEAEVRDLEVNASESESRASEAERALRRVREQRDQLLAQLEELCDSSDAEVGEPIKAVSLHQAMFNSRKMITKMK